MSNDTLNLDGGPNDGAMWRGNNKQAAKMQVLELPLAGMLPEAVQFKVPQTWMSRWFALLAGAKHAASIL